MIIAVDHSGSMIQHAQDCMQLVEKLIASHPDAVVVAFNAGKAYKLMPFDGILEENIGGGTPEVPVLTRLLADVFETHEDEIIQAPVVSCVVKSFETSSLLCYLHILASVVHTDHLAHPPISSEDTSRQVALKHSLDVEHVERLKAI